MPTSLLYVAPGKPYTEPSIFVNNQKLSAIDKFTYLGSTLSRAVYIDDEVNLRIAEPVQPLDVYVTRRGKGLASSRRQK